MSGGSYASTAQEADAFVHQVVRDWREAGLSGVDQALCEFAVRVTQRVSDQGDLERLRAAGLDDVEIHDAAQVVAYFNYITRIADSLGVEQESFIQRWGSGT